MLEDLEGKGVLIHHWDADGICSARLLLKKFTKKVINNKTPKIGNYFLTEKEINDYSTYDFIIVADMPMQSASPEGKWGSHVALRYEQAPRLCLSLYLY